VIRGYCRIGTYKGGSILIKKSRKDFVPFLREVFPLAYCFCCRRKREVKHARTACLKNGREVIRGQCSACGAKVSTFIKKLPSTKLLDIQPQGCPTCVKHTCCTGLGLERCDCWCHQPIRSY